MHDVVTTSTAQKSFFLNTQDDLLPAISITNRPHTTDTNSWHDSDSDQTSETWPPKNDNSPQPVHTFRPTGIQTRSYHSKMSSLSDAAAAGSNHWLFNANGQLVDVDSESASASWDLADEIVRLKIGDVAGENGEDATIRTPPKKLTNSLAHLTETSPLETSSANSVDSSPPSDHQITISHSRGSSTDTTESSSQDSALSAASNTLLSNSIHGTPPSELKERPHSFSGGLSTADLRRLQQAGDGVGNDGSDLHLQQQQQWMQYREPGGEQLPYPSLTNSTVSIHRPQAQPPQLFDYRSTAQGGRDDLQIDYNLQQRNFNPLPPSGMPSAPQAAPSFVQRPANGVPMQYRQPVRGYPQQPGLIPSPPAMGYPAGHTTHMSLGNSQQMYDMMVPSHDNPAVSRVQQQHTVFRGAHHHSASDPSTLREPQLALMGGNMPYAAGIYPPGMTAPPSMPMYPSQYYGQEAYARGDPAMAARLQAQYTGSYGMIPPQLDGGLSSPTSVTSGGQNGPSANNRKLGLYKTELCRSWEEKGSCRYGAKCQFAHGEEELRKVSRHPKYKTEICRTFWVSGSCPYGKRCCFIHTELPAAGGATPQDAPPPAAPRPDGRARSLSTNSDPNEGGVSLLARISAKRNQDSTTPVDMNSTNGYQFTRPPTGSLRVDTSTLDAAASMKQNKSAYPAFASNGVLLPNVDHKGAKSPAPVTAGPDLGRHNNSRMEIVGYNQRVNTSATPPSNVRHSFNGTEEVNFTPSQPTPGHSYTLSSDSTGPPQRASGHVRAGSAGNWGSFSRSNHLSSASFSHGPSGSGDGSINSPWSTTEVTMGGPRLHEKAWA